VGKINFRLGDFLEGFLCDICGPNIHLHLEVLLALILRQGRHFLVSFGKINFRLGDFLEVFLCDICGPNIHLHLEVLLALILRQGRQFLVSFPKPGFNLWKDRQRN